jgi:hypothetical protein
MDDYIAFIDPIHLRTPTLRGPALHHAGLNARKSKSQVYFLIGPSGNPALLTIFENETKVVGHKVESNGS